MWKGVGSRIQNCLSFRIIVQSVLPRQNRKRQNWIRNWRVSVFETMVLRWSSWTSSSHSITSVGTISQQVDGRRTWYPNASSRSETENQSRGERDWTRVSEATTKDWKDLLSFESWSETGTSWSDVLRDWMIDRRNEQHKALVMNDVKRHVWLIQQQLSLQETS